jgi:hypothetical protein
MLDLVLCTSGYSMFVMSMPKNSGVASRSLKREQLAPVRSLWPPVCFVRPGPIAKELAVTNR